MDELFEMYRQMRRIRRIEEALADRYTEQKMRCPMHLSIGQEAVATGVCHVLRKADTVVSNHRGHAHYLAKGGCLNALVAELYGKAGGCCSGRGGSMHLIDREVNFLGSTPIVGGTIPLGVGAAWSAQLLKRDSISAVFLGDGCFEEGVVHESMNFASLKKLPVLFVLENNGYSVYTKLEERQPPRPISSIARAHGLNTWEGDGTDVLSVANAAREAAAKARSGEGPQFLEVETYRWREHCGPNYDDDLGYRPEGELGAWQLRCPVEAARDALMRAREKLEEIRETDDEDLDRIDRVIDTEIDAAFRYAAESPVPPLDSIAENIYASS
ncbi:MAG: thiamine pyrophosphate-dependent dehydrogenase E1 component subunit alpha [Gammaproteobacteria bacterium]|nr:thiamine pyrophosphate-dependent dehydrogenase E1 component subunit alpha [Gammaproteobacteria bacterium]